MESRYTIMLAQYKLPAWFFQEQMSLRRKYLDIQLVKPSRILCGTRRKRDQKSLQRLSHITKMTESYKYLNLKVKM